jgi:hypothetical protein
MGMPTPTNQSNPTSSPQGKGGVQAASPQPQQSQGKGGNVTYPGQGGQPQMGKPNTYSNTVGPWDNASIKPQTQSGKGKGY